jgi:tetratricopeptide (TPR) repeat protein
LRRRAGGIAAGACTTAGSLAVIFIELIAAAPVSYRALVLRAQGRIDQSIGEAESLIAANPEDAYAYMIAGGIEAAAGNQTEAMHAFDRAVEITPDESTYLMRAAYRRGAERVGHNRQSRLCFCALAATTKPSRVTTPRSEFGRLCRLRSTVVAWRSGGREKSTSTTSKWCC